MKLNGPRKPFGNVNSNINCKTGREGILSELKMVLSENCAEEHCDRANNLKQLRIEEKLILINFNNIVLSLVIMAAQTAGVILWTHTGN